MVQHDPPKYRYCLDAQDAIAWVDSLWLAFARENGAPELTAGRVLGRCLWDFIDGATTRDLYRQVHARVREHDQPAVIAYRCDSPALQRHLRMTIRSQPAGGLLYESVLVRVQPQPAVNLLQRDAPRSDAILTLCSGCKRALLEPLGWQELERVSVQLGLFEMERLPEIRYDMCPTCTAQACQGPGL